MEHGLNAEAIAVVAGCVALWGVVSDRLIRWDITAPMAFVVLGVATTEGPLHLVHLQLDSSSILSLVEVTLAIVLFTDAARVSIKAVRPEIGVSLRLLSIGLPLTIGAGTVVAFGIFGWTGIWVAAALGAIVAPTDAALGASIVQDRRVPAAIRRTLTIESGLNDGIATPFVNLFLAGALSVEALGTQSVAGAAVDLLGGAALGVAIGVAGALLLDAGERAGWSGPGFHSMAVLGLAVLAYTTALSTGTNGFVAAFVAGMAYGSTTQGSKFLSFCEDAGELLSLLVWFVFGAVMLVPGLEAAGWGDLLFAVLALTLVRMLPVGVSLLGSGLDRASIGFIGWFGPRGLASVVFGLLAADSLDHRAGRLVLAATVVTVALSVLLHGASATPLSRRYGERIKRLAEGAPEHSPSPPIPARTLSGRRWGGDRRG